MKILTVIGARPQFIKAATVSRAISQFRDIREVIVHTGQHYDHNMSSIFFDQLKIPLPDYNLEVGSGNHGHQTGIMLQRIEEVLIKEKPDWVLVYGDTNSTLAGALASTKLHFKVAHVEAGLRSYNRMMPEEINRILTDQIGDILFAPTENALNILKKEGLEEKSINSGDVMYDSVLYYLNMIKGEENTLYTDLNSNYLLATIHRQENTNNSSRLRNIFTAFSRINNTIILPLHPRTRTYLGDIKISDNVKIIEPLGYLELLSVLNGCNKVLTDSGGLQKEAFFLKKPCITLRTETEWIETLYNGWNYVVSDDIEQITNKIKLPIPQDQKNYFGNGNAAEKIINYLINN